MKIISQGSIPKPPANWWTLLPMTCGNCKTKVQLEDADKPRFGAERRPNGKRWVEIDCPTCGVAIQHDEVAMRGASPENANVVASPPGPETATQQEAGGNCVSRHVRLSADELDQKYQDGFKDAPKNLKPGQVWMPPCPRCGGAMESWDAWLVTGASCPTCKWGMSEGSGCMA